MSDPHARIVRETYNNMAASYDQIDNEAFYINQYGLYMRHLYSWQQYLNGMVLDVGCGTGIQTAWLAKRARGVIGIDIATRLLNVACKKLDGFHNVMVMEADATDLPFEDMQFDAAVSYGETLSHIANYQLAFAEICRVLRPGGFFVFSVLNKWNFSLAYSPLELLKALLTSKGHIRIWRCADDIGILRSTPLKTFTKKELSEIGRNLGFKILANEGIHITSLFVPLKLQYEKVGFWGKRFLELGSLDYRINRLPLLSNMGYTTIYAARKN